MCLFYNIITKFNIMINFFNVPLRFFPIFSFILYINISYGQSPGMPMLTNLYDAFGQIKPLTKDFGFSCLIKWQNKTILFDAGSNADIFKSNTEKLNIDLRTVDAVVISHGHFDHLNGIDYLLKIHPRVKIYMPYDIFWGAPVPFDATGPDSMAGADLPEHLRYFDGAKTKFTINQSGRFWGAQVEYIREPKEIFPGVYLIPTNSPYLGYFSCYPGKSFVEGQFQQEADDCKNTNLPELSLTIKTGQGQTVITGCSHSGVERIVQAVKVFTQDYIDLLCGGFHLIPFDEKTTSIVAQQLKDNLGVHRVAPAHCSGHLGFKVFKNLYGEKFHYFGLGETIH